MANEQRLIDASAIQWEEHYVPDPDSDKQWDYKKELCVLKPTIDAMPTVDAVEVVHGRWYWKPSGEKQWTLTCSVCESQDGTSESYNYCPNCGAKMDGGNEDG